MSKRVLFVCIGNACRSQMAEGFAHTYGADVMVPASAGLSPAMSVARDTRRAMAERDIDIRHHFPKSIRNLGRVQFDMVVNMSGSGLPPDQFKDAQVVDWDVDDPVFMSFEDHCKVRDEIEALVMKLILDLRQAPKEPRFRGQGSGHLDL